MTVPCRPSDTHRVSCAPLSEDLLRGAGQIAVFLFGDPKKRRQVYHLAETKQIPVFQMGGLCARRSTLLNYIAEQERIRASPGQEAA